MIHNDFLSDEIKLEVGIKNILYTFICIFFIIFVISKGRSCLTPIVENSVNTYSLPFSIFVTKSHFLLTLN